jgi:23S rRNA U2552 (ribose-2'-O)-methylase RlmE/FtsJ
MEIEAENSKENYDIEENKKIIENQGSHESHESHENHESHGNHESHESHENNREWNYGMNVTFTTKPNIEYYNTIRIHKLPRTNIMNLQTMDIFTINLEKTDELDILKKWESTYHNLSIAEREEFDTIQQCKNRIEPYHENSRWDELKKKWNMFEYIYSPSSNNHVSVSKYHPISRSFFKLWEILKDMNIVMDRPWVIANLAEGPGGFMDCLTYYRRNIDDRLYGITLPSNHRDIPSWKKIEGKRNRYRKNYHITYGNLYVLNDIQNYVQIFQRDRADFITADGGFDYSENLNFQEQLSYRMIFNEIIVAITIQKVGGDFVLKVFDTMTDFTKKIIYLLTLYYEDVFIIKPYTSRSANSEKYIYCKSFRGITKSNIQLWHNVINDWNYLKMQNPQSEIVNINGFEMTAEFLESMANYNVEYLKYQRKSLEFILEKLDENREFSYGYYHQQLQNAIWWCNYYNLKIAPFYQHFSFHIDNRN